MKTRLFQTITAAMLVVFLTLLFDYCRFAIEHHPHFDFTRVIYRAIQGVIISINIVAMLKFVESFNRRA
jgi:cell shape-determining protein MreD